MEIIENFSPIRFVEYHKNQKINYIDREILGKKKLVLLGKQLNSIENPVFDQIQLIFKKLYPELIAKSSNLYEFHRKIMKTFPDKLFSNSKDSLNEVINNISKNIVSFENIYIDYDCMKNLAILVINCVDNMIKHKRNLSMQDMLKQEKIPAKIQEFLEDLASIKTVKISLFSKVKIKNRGKSFYDERPILINRLSCFEKDIKFEKARKDSFRHEYVYIFFVFFDFLFPSHLETTLEINLDRHLQKYIDENGNYCDLEGLAKNEMRLFSILTTCYFLSENSQNQKLKLIVNDGLKYEFDYLLKKTATGIEEKDIQTFNFLDFFLVNLNASSLSLKFNSLDQFLFSKLNLITFKNIEIRSLIVNLFQNEENLKSSLKRRKIKRLINLTHLDESQVDLQVDTLYNSLIYSSEDIQDELYDDMKYEYNCLFHQFKENMKNLFIILESKINVLQELKLIIKPPENIIDHHDYVCTIICLIFNVLKLTEKEISGLESLEIDSNIDFDLRTLSHLDKSNKIDLRKSNISKLKLNLRITGYRNLTKFIPLNIVSLCLDSLSNDLFCIFVDKLKHLFIEYKKIFEISLSIILSDSDIEKLTQAIFKFFSLNKPDSLEIINFSIRYVLKKNDIFKITEIILNTKNNFNYIDSVEKYNLHFGLNAGSNNTEIYLSKQEAEGRKIKFLRIKQKSATKCLYFLFCLKYSQVYKVLYQPKMRKLISFYAYYYRKEIVID